jgi:tetratricopeptide (TPR) repeat protein
MGNILADRREWVRAEQAFRLALELNPSVTNTHMDYAIAVLMPLDRNEPALAVLAEAIARDPRSADVRRMLAHFQVNARQYDEALHTIEMVRKLEREQHLAPHPWTALWYGRALALSNRFDEALAVFEADPNYWSYLGYTYARMGRRADARALIAAHPDDPRGLMLIYSGLDDTERAIVMLQHLAARNAWRAATWLHRPEMDAIRGDPRVEAVKATLGLTR